MIWNSELIVETIKEREDILSLIDEIEIGENGGDFDVNPIHIKSLVPYKGEWDSEEYTQDYYITIEGYRPNQEVTEDELNFCEDIEGLVVSDGLDSSIALNSSDLNHIQIFFKLKEVLHSLGYDNIVSHYDKLF
jgi:hypothetical protein